MTSVFDDDDNTDSKAVEATDKVRAPKTVKSTVTATAPTTPDTDVDDVHDPFGADGDLVEVAARVAARDPFAEALLAMAPAGEAQVPEGADDEPRVTEVVE